MKKQSILVCLEKLDIGGVETAVLSQTKAFIEQGYRVIVLSKNGIYKRKLEELGALHIEFEFNLENNYNLEKAQDIASIIKRENITQVHIEQFPCILSVYPACCMAQVPYVAYLHMAPIVREDTFHWFFNQFDIYQTALPSFFKNAERIVAITQSNIEYHRRLFDLPKEKYVIKYNSIDFTQYPFYEKENCKKIFLLLARLSKEKLKSIQNGIDIFANYIKKQDAFLKIAGDGNEKENVQKYIVENGIPIDKVEFLGIRQDIPSCMAQSDIVLGVDRVILEAVACKRLAIITGYDTCKGIVLPNNMKKIQEENFSGYNLESKYPQEIADEIWSLSKQEIKNIVDECYQYAKENCSINNNVYIVQETNAISDEFIKQLWKDIIKLEKERQKLIQINKQIEREKEETNLKAQKVISELEQGKLNLKNELDLIYNSRRWRYSSRLLELFKK